jgi:MauM/NapG family ferredoxin protein
MPSRRQFIASTLSGSVAGALALTGLHRPKNAEALGVLASPSLIRPPGSVPERDFLARCIRCGECMKGCPTNTLQPVWLTAGFPGLFSPVVAPVVGPCEPGCNVCGQVCPTGAIRELPGFEKAWAKVGTAYIIKEKCLAWEHDKRCLVCDEVCPYDAVKFKEVPERKVAVPFVHEARCAGCGYCEHHCPVRAKRAIVVEPMGALRLSEGSYIEAARRMGLDLSVRKKGPYGRAGEEPQKGLGPSGLPPGFDR